MSNNLVGQVSLCVFVCVDLFSSNLVAWYTFAKETKSPKYFSKEAGYREIGRTNAEQEAAGIRQIYKYCLFIPHSVLQLGNHFYLLYFTLPILVFSSSCLQTV